MSGCKSHLRITKVLAFILGANTWLIGLCAAQSLPENSELVYYYNGSSRVDLALSLDELVTVGSSTAPGGNVANTRGGKSGAHIKLSTNGGRSGLSTEAIRLALTSGAAEVCAVLYQPNELLKTDDNQQVLTHRFSVKWKHPGEAQYFAAKYGLKITEKVDYSPDTYIAEVAKGDLLSALETANQIYESGEAEFATPLFKKMQHKRAIPNDPLFGQQWHLRNTGTNATGAVAGNDLNLTGVWDSNRGTGVNIAITDDGLETNHPDLSANARTDIDIDLDDIDDDPSPELTEDNHGTLCAGAAAARDNNSIGISGVAPAAGLVGIRLISIPISDVEEAQAMSHQTKVTNTANMVHINSNSWGPTDDGHTLQGPGPLTLSALTNGTAQGRGGKGTVYVWAAGNGAEEGDDSNYDGYANNPNVIAVAATGADGTHAIYSEEGANVLVNAPSSYPGGSIRTTDRTGDDGTEAGDYTLNFGGTSAAAPLAAGCVALMLKANPELTWRDVMHILVNTSTRTDTGDPDWILNAAGHYFSRKYGFGRVNAAAAVTSATTWINVPAAATPLTATQGPPPVNIPDNDPAGLTSALIVSAPSNFKTEHVQVTVKVVHQKRGQLEFFLISPSGTTVKLAKTRDDDTNNYNSWTFSSVAAWGESANGTWQLRVADRVSGQDGKLNSWTIKVMGYLEAHDHDLYVVVPHNSVKYKKAKTGGATMSFSASVGYFLMVPDKKAKVNATVKYYISTDDVFDDGDAPIGQSLVKWLKASKAKTVKGKLLIQPDAKGKYLLAVLESAEDQFAPNNVAAELIPLNAF